MRIDTGRRTGRTFALLVVLGALLLNGCSGEEQLSHKDFVARVNRLCSTLVADQRRIEDQYLEAPDSQREVIGQELARLSGNFRKEFLSLPVGGTDADFVERINGFYGEIDALSVRAAQGEVVAEQIKSVSKAAADEFVTFGLECVVS